MKILVHDYAGHPFQVQLSRALASLGHEVDHCYAGSLQTPRGELTTRDDDPSSLSISEVPMDENYTRYKYSFARRRRMEIAYGRGVAKLIRDRRPAVVISSNTPTEAQEAIVRACSEIESRFIYWLQDFYSIAVDKLLRKKIPLLGACIGAYYKRLERRQLQRSHAIVAITEDFRPILTDQFRIPDRRITVIPNWAPLESIPAGDKTNQWSRARGLDDKFCFLYTGTLGMKHNPELLSNLARQFKNEPSVRVVVVSEGLGAEWLEQTKDEQGLDNLLILPYQPFSELPSVLATGDVLLGVLEEDAGIFSVPSKVLSYLCAARPILLAVPEINLASRIIREERAGFTVAPSDPTGFARKARLLFDDPPLSANCGRNARTYAESNFDISSIASQFANVLLPGRGRPRLTASSKEIRPEFLENESTVAAR
jgi:glycosyltransferase involved in cell wall biosynthesis